MTAVEILFPLEVRGTMNLHREAGERDPRITVYTDDRIRATMERRALTDTWQPVVLRVRARQLASMDAYRQHILQGQLALDGVSVLSTKVGLSASKNAGSARMSLAAVFVEPGREFSRPLVMTLLEDAELGSVAPKGQVWVRASGPITVGGQALAMNVSVDQAERQWEQRQEERKRRFHSFRGLVSEWQTIFERYPPTFPAASNINCYIMRAGDGMVLPSIAYMMQPRPAGIDLAYYENALRVVLRRERTSAGQLAEFELTDRRLANIAMQVLMLWCNYVPYVSDQAWVPLRTDDHDSESIQGDTSSSSSSMWARLFGRRSTHHIDMKHFAMEEFEAAELYDDDDCEGVGAVIVRHYGYLLSTPPEQRSPALQRVCELLQLYAPLLLLCGVTSGDLGGDFAALTAPDAKMGAHMFALFVPVARLMRMIARHSPGATQLVAPAPTLQFELACANTAQMPILCGEGTGLLAPLPLDLPESKRLLLPPALVAATDEAVRAVESHHVLDSVDAVIVEDTRGMHQFSSVLGTRNPVFSNNSLFITDLMQAVHRNTLANGVRKWYHLPQKESLTAHFYRTVQLALTPVFAPQGSRVYSLVFMQRDANAPRDAWRVGCTFSDLLNEGSGNEPRVVAAYPESPPDQKQLDEIIDEMRLEPRPPTLRPPPRNLGENNTWDPTALVPSAAKHAEMDAALHTVRRAALITEVKTMRHAIRYANSASFVGSPHLVESCDCERVFARRLLEGRDSEVVRAFDGLSVDELVAQFVSAMSATSMPPDQPGRRLPLVCEPSFNYEQWEQRSAGMIQVVTQNIRLSNALLLPAGLHAEFEHVTATTGGLMPRVYALVQY